MCKVNIHSVKSERKRLVLQGGCWEIVILGTLWMWEGRGRLQAAPVPPTPIPVLSGCSCVSRASCAAQLLLAPGTASAVGTPVPSARKTAFSALRRCKTSPREAEPGRGRSAFLPCLLLSLSPGKSELPGSQGGSQGTFCCRRVAPAAGVPQLQCWHLPAPKAVPPAPPGASPSLELSPRGHRIPEWFGLKGP